MPALKMVAAVALVVLTAWFVPALWVHGYRFLAIVMAASTVNILTLGWWHHVMDLNRSHDSAMAAAVDRLQKK